MELREKIATALLRSQEAQLRYTVAPDNLKLADAILQIPEIKEALALMAIAQAGAAMEERWPSA